MKKIGWVVFFLFTVFTMSSFSSPVEKNATDFISTNYLTAKDIRKIEKTKYLTGVGAAEYQFKISQTGWYEFYVQAAAWSTELDLDGKFLIYTPFKSGVWKNKDKAYKVMNIYLTKGIHRIKFSRLWSPGLPVSR